MPHADGVDKRRRVRYDSRLELEEFSHFGWRSTSGLTHTACGVTSSSPLPVSSFPEHVTCLRCQRSTQLKNVRDQLPPAFVISDLVAAREPGSPRQIELRRLVWDSKDEPVVHAACEELTSDYGEMCWNCSRGEADRILVSSPLVRRLYEARYDEVLYEMDEARAQQICDLMTRRYDSKCPWCMMDDD